MRHSNLPALRSTVLGLLGIGEVLDRLGDALSVHAADVWRSLRPPVVEGDLDALRQAVAPYDLPTEVVALLRWADGQVEDAPWFPSFEAGRLLRAADAAGHYKWLREEAAPGAPYSLLVPIVHEGWNQVGVELVGDGPGVVVDYSFGDDLLVRAPTLAAMLDVTAEMILAGMGEPKEGEDARIWRAQREELVAKRPGWDLWPYDRVLSLSENAWPPHWRSAPRG